MTKSFFSEQMARDFAKQLKGEGCDDVQIWTDIDGFGQKVYTVKWN